MKKTDNPGMATEVPRRATEAQINANRENAQKSTGPRSTQGKAASNRNGLTHGLCAGKHILPGEDPGDFLFLVQDLFNTFRPVGEAEEKPVLRIAAGQWRLDRAFPMEAGLYRDRLADVAKKDKAHEEQYARDKESAGKYGDPVPPPPTPPDEGDLLARAFIADCAGPNSLTKLARYEGAIERSIDRSLRQLKAFQAARNTPGSGANQSAPEPVSPPSKTEICKANPKNGGIVPAQMGVVHSFATPSGPSQASRNRDNVLRLKKVP